MRRAFSLIELMVVVALIGIMAALAFPSISASARRANAPVHGVRVHGFLSDARNLARRTNRCVRVTRAADGSTLTTQTFSTCAITERCRCRASALADETRTLRMGDVLPTGGRVEPFVNTTLTSAAFAAEATTDDADNVVFLADGSTPYGAAVEVPVVVRGLEAGDRRTTLEIMPATGIVRLPIAEEAP